MPIGAVRRALDRLCQRFLRVSSPDHDRLGDALLPQSRRSTTSRAGTTSPCRFRHRERPRISRSSSSFTRRQPTNSPASFISPRRWRPCVGEEQLVADDVFWQLAQIRCAGRADRLRHGSVARSTSPWTRLFHAMLLTAVASRSCGIWAVSPARKDSKSLDRLWPGPSSPRGSAGRWLGRDRRVVHEPCGLCGSNGWLGFRFG